MEIIDNKTLRAALENEGVEKSSIEAFESKFDIEEMQRIVSSCETPEEYFEKLSEKYPTLKNDDLKESFDKFLKQSEENADNSESEEEIELDEDDLEAVAGGSVGSWFKKNWRGLAVGAACLAIPGIGLFVAPTAMQLVNKQAEKKNTASDAEEDKSHTL